VFFVSNRTEPAGLYRVESNGAALTALDPTFGSNQFDPAPHPLLDTQLLFTSGRGGSNDIWRKTLSVIDDSIININVTEDLLAHDRNPDWAPDASYIVYVSNRGGSDNIWLTDAAGVLPRQVTNFDQPVSDPAVSPFAGEARCAAALRNPDGSSDIVIIDLLGGTVISNLTGENGG
jgi:Tol biopolymer transport system component